MKPIILSLVLSMICLFQADSADVRFKPAPSKSITPPVIKKKPQNSLNPATPAKPDLVVQSFTLISTTPQNMVVNGQNCPFELVYRNAGGPSPVNKMLVSFQHDVHYGRNYTLDVPAPNQSLTLSGELGVSIDRCMAISYSVTLDAHNQVDESNENNNTASKSIAVEHHPDIGFCKNPSVCEEKFINGGVNQDIYIGLEVYNYGCAISPACSMDLNFPEKWPQNVKIPPISPGKFFPYHTYMKWDTPGVKMGEIIIRDPVNDARSFNNRVKFKVNIVQ